MKRQTQQKKQNTRLDMVVTPGLRHMVEKLAKRTGAASMTEVVRRGVKLYDILTKLNNEGSEVFVRAADGTVTRLALLFD